MEKRIDWEQRRYEIAKEVLPLFISAIYIDNDAPFGKWIKETKQDKDAIIKKPVDFALHYATEMVIKLIEWEERWKSKDYTKRHDL